MHAGTHTRRKYLNWRQSGREESVAIMSTVLVCSSLVIGQLPSGRVSTKRPMTAGGISRRSGSASAGKIPEELGLLDGGNSKGLRLRSSAGGGSCRNSKIPPSGSAGASASVSGLGGGAGRSRASRSSRRK